MIADAARRGGAVVSDAYLPAMLAFNPYTYHRVGESVGPIAADYQGNNAGAYINTPTLGVAGIPGAVGNTAVTFDRAQSERIDLSDDANLRGMSAISIMTWIKTTSSGQTATICGFWGDAIAKRMWLLLLTSGGLLAFYMYSAGLVGAAASAALVNDGLLHSVGCSWASTDYLRLFVDGSQVGISPITLPSMLNTPTGTVPHIGANGPAAAPINHFPGTIDEHAILTTQLSAANFASLDSVGNP